MREQLVATLRLLCPTGPIEIRALGDRMQARRFETHDAAADWAVSEERTARAVYVVMSQFDAALIRGTAVDDQAVTARRWLLVDVDPTRPADSNSTREELGLATSTAVAIEGLLTDLGFSLPVRALSGNGAHLLYRVDLPNDADSSILVNGVLRYLAAEFSVEGRVSVDTTVGNPSRITKLYGTWARKAAATAARPHRQSKITRIPEALEPVSLAALRAVAARAPATSRPTVATPTGSEYDIGQVLSRVPPIRTFAKDGSTWHVVVCPWAYEHSTTREDEATVVTVGAGGGLGFRCLHAHCAERRWEDFRNHLGIETKSWQERRKAQNAPGSTTTSTTTTPPGHANVAPVAPQGSEGAIGRVTVADKLRRPAVIARMGNYSRTGTMPGALATGMRRLDAMLLGGLRPGKFYILGGESGRGKTTLLLQWAFHIAPNTRLVGIVTPEMDIESLDERAYAQTSGYTLGEYKRNPDGGRTAWERATIPQNVRASFDPKDIQAFAHEEQPTLLIVDYAQQAVDYEAPARHTALGRLGADCLAIAKQLNIPVVLGTQVNVTAERDFSVRETRILEHQADAMIFIDVQYEKAVSASGERKQKQGAALVLEKNRHGASGRVPIKWEPEKFRFSEEEPTYTE